MKKGITFILLVVSFVFISFNMVFAFGFSSLGGMFGGRILLTKALPIQLLETVGYTCPTYGGTSLSIIPIGSPVGTPTDYFIPSFVASKTRTTPSTGKLILGKYAGTIIITCTYPDPPNMQTVTLPIINLFGTSGGNFSGFGGGKKGGAGTGGVY